MMMINLNEISKSKIVQFDDLGKTKCKLKWIKSGCPNTKLKWEEEKFLMEIQMKAIF